MEFRWKCFFNRTQEVERKRSLGQSAPYYNNFMATTQCALLKLSGNVEINPSSNTEVICDGCSKALRKNQDGLRCMGDCARISSAKFAGMLAKDLQEYQSFANAWYWITCCLFVQIRSTLAVVFWVWSISSYWCFSGTNQINGKFNLAVDCRWRSSTKGPVWSLSAL